MEDSNEYMDEHDETISLDDLLEHDDMDSMSSSLEEEDNSVDTNKMEDVDIKSILNAEELEEAMALEEVYYPQTRQLSLARTPSYLLQQQQQQMASQVKTITNQAASSTAVIEEDIEDEDDKIVNDIEIGMYEPEALSSIEETVSVLPLPLPITKEEEEPKVEEKGKGKKKKKLKNQDLIDEQELPALETVKGKKGKGKDKKKEEEVSGDISLYPYQVEHKDALLSILASRPFALDFSMLGTGKTYTSSWIFQNNPERFKHLVVVAPVSVKSKWNIMKRSFNLKMEECVSYSELRSAKFKQPKHGLLYRKDYMTKIEYKDTGQMREIEKCDFTCTPRYKQMVEEGLLLIIDEIQHIKNTSEQSDACQELIRPIIEAYERQGTMRADEVMWPESKSRVILLSGSPVDKKEQVLHFFKVLRVMKSDKLCYYNPAIRQTVWKGMQEIEDYCKTFPNGNTEVNEIRYGTFYNHIYEKVMYDYSYQLFQKIVKVHTSSTMLPCHVTSKIHKYNAYYRLMDKKMTTLLKQGIRLLSSATRYNHSTGNVDFTQGGIANLRSVQRALIMIETAKIPMFVRITKQRLEKHPTMKMVLCVNYTKTIEDLKRELAEYNPLELQGKMTVKKRIEAIEAFQQPNTNHRVLIGNVAVCSSGIDLDDQHGKFPRNCLVSPNYSTITLYQLCHRFQRANTKSSAVVHFVFCEEATELSILNALAMKSSIMKEITEKQVEYGIQFPVDFTSWYETPGVKKRMEEAKKATMHLSKRRSYY
jgi:hypothetical protein